MQNEYIDQCLNFTCEIARQLLRNGAEMYRVEESARRILKAYGFERTEVFAIPSSIIITIDSDSSNHTKSVRIYSSSNNLDKLEKLNELCRHVCRERTDLKEAKAALNAIMAQPNYSFLFSCFGYVLVAFFFTLLWGGTFLDAFVAGFCGLIVKFVMVYMARTQTSIFFIHVSASMLLVLVPLVLELLHVPIHPDMIIIGAIMLQVPGIAITNVMRDILVGDFLTAISKLAEVLIVAIAIAIGIAIPYGLLHFFM